MKVINLETREYEHRLTKWPFFGLGNYALFSFGFNEILPMGMLTRHIYTSSMPKTRAKSFKKIKFKRFLFFWPFCEALIFIIKTIFHRSVFS